MVGQKILRNLINESSLDNFSHSTIFVGEKGCGKHLLVSMLAEKLNLQLLDITDNLNLDYINEIYLRSTPSIYLINASEITEKEQNVILKFLEEPLKNAYIVLIVESLNFLLPTIKNRCQVYTFESYTKEELFNFTADTDLLEVCTTPGQILEASRYDVKSIYDLCEKFISKVKNASYANTLSISDKINYKDNYDKIDLDIFFKFLIYFLREKIVAGDNTLYDFYNITREYKEKLDRDPRLNKQHLFENYLSNI